MQHIPHSLVNLFFVPKIHLWVHSTFSSLQGHRTLGLTLSKMNSATSGVEGTSSSAFVWNFLLRLCLEQGRGGARNASLTRSGFSSFQFGPKNSNKRLPHPPHPPIPRLEYTFFPLLSLEFWFICTLNMARPRQGGEGLGLMVVLRATVRSYVPTSRVESSASPVSSTETRGVLKVLLWNVTMTP